jgi:hypothetical protein
LHLYLDLSSTWEKTCICLSEPSLLHLTWISSSTHLPVNDTIPLFFMAEYYSIVYNLYHIKVRLSVVRHMDHLCSLVIVNNAAINMGVQVSLLYPDLQFFGYMSKFVYFLTISHALRDFEACHLVTYHLQGSLTHSKKILPSEWKSYLQGGSPAHREEVLPTKKLF